MHVVIMWIGALMLGVRVATGQVENPPLPESVAPPSIEVSRWGLYEFARQGQCKAANPFTDASLKGQFTAPSGKTTTVDGFYDGGTTWKLRFSPDEEGEWAFHLRGEGVDIDEQGRLKCNAPRGHGFIRIHQNNPYGFAYSDGTPFFPMGDTCYGLFDDSPITPALRAEYLKTRRSQHFNFVRMTVGHSMSHAEKDPAYWAWGGTPHRPDLDRFNPVFFRAFDELMQQMRASGMNVELLLLNFYRPPFTDTNLWTSSRERLWLRYLLARYGSFDNIFLWTLANEYETHPDGKYRLDFPGDVDWAKATARFIKAKDPYRHLVTVHPVVSASRQGGNPRDPIDPPWRIGEFFGVDDAMDVLSQQTGGLGDGLVWDESEMCWTGDPTQLVDSIRADRKYKKPVLNSENGYEYLRGQATERKQVHKTDKVRRSAWRVICAGGHIAAGFHGTIGHSDVWNKIDAPNHYAFMIKDEGAASQLAILSEFFTALPFGELQPFLDVSNNCVTLASAGKCYVVYFPHGGKCDLDLSGAKDQLKARWFNPRTGEFGPPIASVTAGLQQSFTAPDANDWTLLVEITPSK
jgi:hypothetical protein